MFTSRFLFPAFPHIAIFTVHRLEEESFARQANDEMPSALGRPGPWVTAVRCIRSALERSERMGERHLNRASDGAQAAQACPALPEDNPTLAPAILLLARQWRRRQRRVWGAWAEEAAARYLSMGRSWYVLARNWRVVSGEADLVCFCPEDHALVIVEVRARRRRELEMAASSVRRRKLQKQRSLAWRAYLTWRDLAGAKPLGLRVDVITVSWLGPSGGLTGGARLWHLVGVGCGPCGPGG